TGARPGEVAHMRREHVVDGWWTLPGTPVPDIGWPGTKNSVSHDVWLAPAARAIVDELVDGTGPSGFVFATERGGPVADLAGAMRAMCKALGVPRATPHDLRRSFATRAAALGFDRHCLHRWARVAAAADPAGGDRRGRRPAWPSRYQNTSAARS